MGKQIVLSDLPVHKEQAPSRAFFFPPEDAESLANALLEAQRNFEPQQDATLQAEARAHFSEHQKEFGKVYEEIVLRTIAL